ncbi:hypothetical protein ACPOL_2246 [Acidisarcina polymorpha]|uniref:Uncharacterized protein n=1 Tax=Acidisarcina polymorpha TaxID=2211140 RepID=A0A2Z5FXW6_9BACT|nr:hypothetical protein ACPOL_2246 [Acidisarcina polymorpha]
MESATKDFIGTAMGEAKRNRGCINPKPKASRRVIVQAPCLGFLRLRD